MQQPASTDIVRQEDEQFGRRLAGARREAELSQRALAASLKDLGLSIDPSAITRIEKGERSIRLGEAKLMAIALDVSLSVLTGEPDDSPADALEAVRRTANGAMNDARRSAAIFLSQTLEAREILRRNPELLENLDASEVDDPPGSPDEYLPWVLERLRRVASEPERRVDLDDEADIEIVQQMSVELTKHLLATGEGYWRERLAPDLGASFEERSHKESILGWLASIGASTDGMAGLEFDRLRQAAESIAQAVSIYDSERAGLHHLDAEMSRWGRSVLHGLPMHSLTRYLRTVAATLQAGGLTYWLSERVRAECQELVDLTDMAVTAADQVVVDGLLEFVGKLRTRLHRLEEDEISAILSVIRAVLEDLGEIDDLRAVVPPIRAAAKTLNVEIDSWAK